MAFATQVFHAADTDGSGTISLAELGAALNRLGKHPTDAQLHALLTAADRDGSGEIDFSEFLALLDGLGAR
jgi:Ca2+-binding EF-hand superfamily protein